MLVMAVFFMLLPVFTGFSEIESTIALAGYGTFNVLIWILLADILVHVPGCRASWCSASAGAW